MSMLIYYPPEAREPNPLEVDCWAVELWIYDPTENPNLFQTYI